jgi:hypothetical protein
MGAAPGQEDETAEAIGRRIVGRRAFGRQAAVAAPAVLGGAVLGGMLSPQPADAATTASWGTTGNSGSSSATNFLGTTDSQSLVVRTNNVEQLRVVAAGNVGVGTTAPTAKLHVASSSPVHGLFARNTATGATAALTGTTASTDANAIAVQGTVTPTTAGATSAGVCGTNQGTGSGGYGVLGSHAGSGYGVAGIAGNNGQGVGGVSIGSGVGVEGLNFGGTGPGGQFIGGPIGLNALASHPGGTAVQATGGAGTGASAVRAYSGAGADDLVHPEGAYYAAAGEFSGPNGLIGAASTDTANGYGVVGLANSASGVGVYAGGSGGATALVAAGDANVLGTLTKSGGSFRIDHPLAPAHKYLSHSFVESPDMKNIYDGVVVADPRGQATITMPTWFDALNRDFRYQLTPLGGPAPDLHVAAELADRTFQIAGARPNQRVSWMVTGIRQDAWANAHRIPVEQDKPSADQGTYLHPALFGADAGASVLNRQR